MSDHLDPDSRLTHIDLAGKTRMVDVGDKPIVQREAIAIGFIKMSEQTINEVRAMQLKKGDVLSVAQIAGIQAAKMTPSLIPLCHNLLLSKISLQFEIKTNGIEASCTVSCQGKTGVEMEALTGVSVSLLTIYDMCKAIDKKMVIERINLLKKEKKDILPSS
jgi:cyclic pyranopterin phosphate synthase